MKSTVLIIGSVWMSALVRVLALVLVLAPGSGCGTEQQCTDHSECLESEVCNPETHKCQVAACGDGIVSHDEECDDGEGNSDVEPDGCRTSCTEASCGDGVVDAAEECDDGADTGQAPSGCHADCTQNYCGDGRIAGTESCDGSNLDGQDCFSVTGAGFGEIACTGVCAFDTSGCHACGNGVMQGPEACDGTDFGPLSCESLGFDGGTLQCFDECGSVDDTLCTTCGDGVCEVSKGETTLTCGADCAWVTVSAGRYHTCATKGDGSAWCWGNGSSGELGHGTLESSPSPQRVLSLQGVVAVRASKAFTCARDAFGSAWCWGNNEHGVLGNGSLTDSTAPTPVTPVGSPFEQLALGSNFVCGRTAAAEVWCWGRNGYGQLGTGNNNHSQVPVQTANLSGVSRIATGYFNAWAVIPNGSCTATFAWGLNDHGQSGTGAPANINIPEQGLGGHDVSWISGGGYHGCLVDLGGTWVRCWGSNTNGQLGNGTTTDSSSPVPADVQGYRVWGGRSFTCALNSVGAVRCWGDNDFGQLGNGTVTEAHSMAEVSGMTDVADLSAGGNHACAIKVDGTLWCWGANGFGQLGAGTTADASVPMPIIDPYL